METPGKIHGSVYNERRKTEGGETILYVNKYYEKNLTTGENTTYGFSATAFRVWVWR